MVIIWKVGLTVKYVQMSGLLHSSVQFTRYNYFDEQFTRYIVCNCFTAYGDWVMAEGDEVFPGGLCLESATHERVFVLTQL